MRSKKSIIFFIYISDCKLNVFNGCIQIMNHIFYFSNNIFEQNKYVNFYTYKLSFYVLFRCSLFSMLFDL